MCKKWTYNFMTCEIELPLTDFYLLVDNEELCHLRQGRVIKATGRQGNQACLIRIQEALISKPGFIYLSFIHCKSWALWITVLLSGVSPSTINTRERQGHPLKSVPWERKQARHRSWAKKTAGEFPEAMAAAPRFLIFEIPLNRVSFTHLWPAMGCIW